MKFDMIACILLSLLTAGGYVKGKEKGVNSDGLKINENLNKWTKTKKGSEVFELSRADVIKDMRFISEKVKEHHISAVNGLPKDFADQMKLEIDNLPEKVNIIEEFKILCRLMSSLHDSHSMMGDFYNPSGKLEAYFKKVIPRRLRNWYKSEKNKNFELNPEIIHNEEKCKVTGVVNWNGVSYEALYNRFKECFPHESDRWCRANFELGNGQYDAPRLALAGIDITKPLEIKLNVYLSERVKKICKRSEDSFKKNGKIANMISPFSSVTKKVELKNRSKIENSKIKNIEWLSHSIDKDKNVGIFTLNECNYNKEYRTKVDKFFDEIFENKISNIIIDLRNNSGGDSRVLDSFAYNIDIKSDIKLPRVEVREGNEIVKIPPTRISPKKIKSMSGREKFYDGKNFYLDF